jgi:hypothetical protein
VIFWHSVSAVNPTSSRGDRDVVITICSTVQAHFNVPLYGNQTAIRLNANY